MALEFDDELIDEFEHQTQATEELGEIVIRSSLNFGDGRPCGGAIIKQPFTQTSHLEVCQPWYGRVPIVKS